MTPTTFRVDRPAEQKQPFGPATSGVCQRPAAILVAHGMGQQVPFETLDDVLTGLGGGIVRPVAKTVVVGGERLQRLEARLALSDGSEREVHIYEAYWAPLTEGQVTLRDVMGFLFRAGVTGATRGSRPFNRWLFGDYAQFPVPVRSVLYLVVALAVVSALVVLNALIIALAAGRAPLHTPPSWLGPTLFRDITTILNALVCTFGLFASCLLLSRSVRHSPSLGRIAGALTIVAFALAIWATLAATVAAGSVMAFHILSDTGGSLSFFERLQWGNALRPLDNLAEWGLLIFLIGGLIAIVGRWSVRVILQLPGAVKTSSGRFTVVVCVAFAAVFGLLAALAVELSAPFMSKVGIVSWRHGLAWPAVIATAVLVRGFLIQYVGDVAAYVQPQVLDRFAELRHKIKESVWKIARGVYSESYDDIILVGHSLGSVVMYDVLNRLLVDRAVGAKDAPEIIGRTRLMLTVGSPLDKTAFIFGTVGRRSEGRDALAAALQPLITERGSRPRWVNVHSRWDFISGALDYYDLPDRSNPHPVENRPDPEATTLLWAHVEYWTNGLLFKTILEHLSEKVVE